MGGPLSAMGVLMHDADEWKRRALAAEKEVAAYRRVKAEADEAFRTYLQVGPDMVPVDLGQAIESLSDELSRVESVVKFRPRDFFNQKVAIDHGGHVADFEIVERPNLGQCSTLDFFDARIEIERDQPASAKAIGLLFQLVQLADVAASVTRKAESELSAAHLHQFVPGLLALLALTGMLNPEMPVTVDSIEEAVQAARAKAT